MMDLLGQQLRAGLVLLLCVLTAVLPSRGLHLSLCTHSGTISSGACPCEDVIVVPTCCTHCDGPALLDAGSRDDQDDPAGDCEDCCQSLGVEEVSLPLDLDTDPWGDDPGVVVGYGGALSAAPTLAHRSTCRVLATGPPPGHQLRRSLAAHASVVLLI